MGRERTRAWEFIFLCAAGLMFFVLLSCAPLQQKNRTELTLEVAPKPEIQKEELQKEVKKEEPQKEVKKEVAKKEDLKKQEDLRMLSEHFLRARKLLEQRDFDGCLKENQKILSFPSQNSRGDEALFNMGLIYAHFFNPKKDYNKSIGLFRKLIKEYPQSPLVEQARIWTGVLQESEKLSQTIQKLNQVIEESKHVDIEIEEKKREKAK